jgi:hypothetical protein
MLHSINNQTQIPRESLMENTNMEHQYTKSLDSGRYNNTMDIVTITQTSETINTYSGNLTPAVTADRGYEMLRRLVTNMLKEQGIEYEIAESGSLAINIAELSQEEAQELITDDGYFSVEQTSDRIVNFALSLAAGDVNRLDAVKEGVEDGFNQALEAFGGTLPDISYETFDAVLQKLDAWAAEAHNYKAYN